MSPDEITTATSSLRSLSYAIEYANRAEAVYYDSAFVQALSDARAEVYDALTDAILAAKLGHRRRTEVTLALEAVRRHPAERARIDVALMAMIAIPHRTLPDLHEQAVVRRRELMHLLGKLAGAEMAAQNKLRRHLGASA